MATLSIPEDLDRRLIDLAAFAGCEKADVIRILLDSLSSTRDSSNPAAFRTPRRSQGGTSPARAPRERGAQVELGGQAIRVDSVRDLYDKVLRYVVKHGKEDAIRALLPHKTSPQRYLIADRPVHPNGNPFRVPVEYAGLFMEAHKPYNIAMSQLGKLLSNAGVSFRYLGNTGPTSLPAARGSRVAHVRFQPSRRRRPR